MISKQFLISFLTALSIACLSPGGESFAQSGNGRTAGYHGNVMVTDHLGVFVGLETSHGYMFDKHNYLKDRSSLVLGMKTGWSHALTTITAESIIRTVFFSSPM